MTTDAATLKQAKWYHDAGYFQQAEKLYRAILNSDPGQVDALQYLAIVAYQAGRTDLAVEHLREATRHGPELAEVHVNLARILGEQGKVEEAIASCRNAVRIKPDYPEAHNGLGVALKAEG